MLSAASRRGAPQLARQLRLRRELVRAVRHFRQTLRDLLSKWADIVKPLLPRLNLDSASQMVRQESEKALKQEMAWAHHISCPAVIAPTPTRDCRNYARAIYSQFSGYGNTSIYIHMPLVWPDDPDMTTDPWETWNDIRMQCEHHPSLFVALEITSDLPDDDTLSQVPAPPRMLRCSLSAGSCAAACERFCQTKKRHVQRGNNVCVGVVG